jgi:hypothetical protein
MEVCKAVESRPVLSLNFPVKQMIADKVNVVLENDVDGVGEGKSWVEYLGSNFISCMFASSSPTTIPRAAPSDMKAVDSTVWLSMSLETRVRVRSSSRHTKN